MEKGMTKVWMREIQRAVSLFEHKIDRTKEGAALLFSLSSAITKDVT